MNSLEENVEGMEDAFYYIQYGTTYCSGWLDSCSSTHYVGTGVYHGMMELVDILSTIYSLMPTDNVTKAIINKVLTYSGLAFYKVYVEIA